MYCNHCGKEIPDGSKFCGGCGKQLPSVQGIQNHPQHPPAPQIHVTAASISTISPAAAGGITAGLSALTMLFYLLPWATLSEFLAMMLDTKPNQNVFQIMGFMFSLGFEEEELGLIFLGVLLLLFIIIAVLFQISAILNGINLTLGKQKGLGTAATMAGITTILLCVVAWITVAVADEGDGVYSLGAWSFFCCFLSVGQIVINLVFDKLLANKLAEKRAALYTICPHCGTSYEKLTAATRCPICHKLPGDPVAATPKSVPAPAPKPDTITCPFCKTAYPKGTIFCDKCKAQIGSSIPTKVPAAYCSGCGRKLNDGDVFCPGCGKRL